MLAGPVIRHIALLVLLVAAAAACYAVGFHKGFVLLAVLGGEEAPVIDGLTGI